MSQGASESSCRGKLKRGHDGSGPVGRPSKAEEEDGNEVTSGPPGLKRPTLQRSEDPGSLILQQQQTEQHIREQEESMELPELLLHVKWTSVTGRARINELPLCPMASTDDLSGVHKRLVARVFSSSERPSHIESPCYLRYSTSEECLNFPADVLQTNFKLIATHQGWQYVVHESSISDPMIGGEAKMHVTIIEFETIARLIGHLGIRLSMVAYPIVCINKSFLSTLVKQMRTDPNFKGILV